MSGRHRQVKRRIRALEYSLDDTDALLLAYARVLDDVKAHDVNEHGITVHVLAMRVRQVSEAREMMCNELRREEELLANMPKRLGVSPHDAGDEQ